MLDVLLVNPPSLRRYGPIKEHLGLGYLAAALRHAGFSVKIIDAAVFGLDCRALNDELSRNECHILGVSVLFQDSLKPVLDWLADLRGGGFNAHITIGGHPATFSYNDILESYSCVDSIVRGEGEKTLVELAEAVIGDTDWRHLNGLAYRANGEVIVNTPRPLINDLDSLQWPARDVYTAKPEAFEQVSVIGTRGCHENCSFCSIATFYRSFKGRVWRRRRPSDVFDEIDFVQRIHPSPFVMMYDDSFIGPGKVGKKQALEFAQELAARKQDYIMGVSCRADQVEEDLFKTLWDAGLRFVFLGIESGNDATLSLFSKNVSSETNRRALAVLRKLSFAVEIGFIMFNPYTTFDNIREDLDFLRDTKIGPEIGNLSNLGLFPGQPILKKIEADGLLRGNAFGYSAAFVDKSVGDLFHAVKDKVFSDFRPPPELAAAKQALLMGRLKLMPLPLEDFTRAEALIDDFHQAVYETLLAAVDLFDGGPVKSEEINELRIGFTDRVAGFSGKQKVGSQP